MVVEEADAEIYRKHADDLTRFATGLVGPGDAADVVAKAVLDVALSLRRTAETHRIGISPNMGSRVACSDTRLRVA